MSGAAGELFVVIFYREGMASVNAVFGPYTNDRADQVKQDFKSGKKPWNNKNFDSVTVRKLRTVTDVEGWISQHPKFP